MKKDVSQKLTNDLIPPRLCHFCSEYLEWFVFKILMKLRNFAQFISDKYIRHSKPFLYAAQKKEEASNAIFIHILSKMIEKLQFIRHFVEND